MGESGKGGDDAEEDSIEVDFVINIHKLLKDKDKKGVEEEINSIVKAVRSEEKGKRILTKVILETCYLSDEQVKWLCRVAERGGADFVKTSTGYGTGGARVEDVRLMRGACGLPVKAAGGVKTFEDAVALIEAGASRLGTISGVEIMQGFRGGVVSRDALARMIDHTNLSPGASSGDIEETCRQAVVHGFKCVCVRPGLAGVAARALKGSGVKVCFVLGFKSLTRKDDGRFGLKRYDVTVGEKLAELEEGLAAARNA